MTIIVMDSDEDSIVLAADQLWVEDDHLVSYATKLVPIMKGTKPIGVIATAGEARKGIQFEAKLTALLGKAPVSANYLQLLRTFVDETWPKKKCPSTIVVIRGIGLVVDEDGCVTAQQRWAIGSGSSIALGAMWNRKGSAGRLAKLGCQAACELTNTCGGKIDVFEMPRHPA